MKSLSINPFNATDILFGYKTIECRTWHTDHRGDMLVCSTSRPTAGSICRHALCVVRLVDVVPFAEEHLDRALIDEAPQGSFAWILDDVRWIEPFPVKGKLGLYDVDDSLIKMIDDSISNYDALRRYYEPIMTWKDRHTTEEETREWWELLLSEAI